MKEKRFVHLTFSRGQLHDGGFQNKTVLEILGVKSGVCYYRAIFVNGNFQYSDFFVPIRGLSREGIANRLLRKTIKRMEGKI